MSEYAVTLSPQSPPGVPAEPDQFVLVAGQAQETAGSDEHTMPVLVVAGSPDDRHTVATQPIVLVHLRLDDEVVQEAVCVPEGMEPAAFAAACAAPDGPEKLRAAIERAYPGRRCTLLAIEDVCRAELVLGMAWLNYLRVSPTN